MQKDDQSLILESVKGLISDGVSGLAIKIYIMMNYQKKL